jgi:hypothetical protein
VELADLEVIHEGQQVVGGEEPVGVAAHFRPELAAARVADHAIARLGEDRLLIGKEFGAARARMEEDHHLARSAGVPVPELHVAEIGNSLGHRDLRRQRRPEAHVRIGGEGRSGGGQP